MSTTRRRLGTGPSTTSNTLTANTSPRLLPVERIGPAVLLDDDEHQDVAQPSGRRTLGLGTTGAP